MKKMKPYSTEWYRFMATQINRTISETKQLHLKIAIDAKCSDGFIMKLIYLINPSLALSFMVGSIISYYTDLKQKITNKK